MPQKFPKDTETTINFRRNLVKHTKVVHLYDEFFAEEVSGFKFEIEPKKKDNGWHPSGHCTTGVRELYHHALNPNGDGFSLGVRKAFPVGHFWHQLLQHATLKLGLAESSAIERRGFHGWGDTKLTGGSGAVEFAQTYGGDEVWHPWQYATGQGDVAPLSTDQWTGIVDYKTMNVRDFKLADGGVLPDWAEQKYEAQINIYMDFFDLEHGMIIGIQKDSPHNFCELEYARNQPLIDTIYAKWEFVSACLDAGVEPEPEDNKLFALDHLFEGPSS